jgi:prepilin-type N-terminal cleavage/methylation domain-containing protein
MKRGLTLVELLMAMVMLAAITGVALYLFSAVLRVWHSQETRSGIDIELDWRMEEIVRDLREAVEIQSTAGYNEIRFSPDGINYYIYYLYNPGDVYVPPPAFNQDEYALKRAQLTGDINGTFSYGGGKVFVKNVLPPATSELSRSGDLLTIDLTAQRGDETIRSKTEVQPRNL